MAVIKTRKGEDILVDDNRLEELSKFTWFVNNTNKYAYTMIPNKYINSDKRKMLAMHRYLTECPSDMVIDHLNMNRLDNRLENLEIVTHSENSKRGANHMHERNWVKFLNKNNPEYF